MGTWTTLISQDAEFSLWDAVDSTEADFRGDFLKHWGLENSGRPEWMDDDGWLALRKLHGLANQIADVVTTLVRAKGLGPSRLSRPEQLSSEAETFQKKIDSILDIVKTKGGLESWGQVYWQLTPQVPSDPRTQRGVFRNSFQIAISEAFIPSLDLVTARAEELIARLVDVPGERSRAYLSRVSRCYCLDHVPELAVMCRAVVDAALSEIVSDDEIRLARSMPKRDRVGLAHRIAHVESYGLLTREATDAIGRLKTAGDDAVHVSPGLEPDRHRLMDDLVISLNAIAKREREHGKG